MKNILLHLRNILHSEKQPEYTLNKEEINKLIYRLKEAEVSTQRFLKIGENKAAFERGFQNRLYSPEAFNEPCGCISCKGKRPHPSWGILGKDGLVLVDFDKPEMYRLLSEALPETFEVTSPRRKLQHKYYVVTDGVVNNAVLHLPNDYDSEGKAVGAGEIRAQNNYLVAPGTQTEYGTYIVTKDVPIAKVTYENFISAVKPYLKSQRKRLNPEDVINGVGEGKRHETGMQYAMHLVGYKKLDYATALHEMRQWNKLNNPPMSDADLERMVRNAVAYAEEEDELPTLRDLFPPIEMPDGSIKKQPIKPYIIANWLATHRNFKYNAKTETLYYGDKRTYRWTIDGAKRARHLISKILGKEDNEALCKQVIYSLENLTWTDEIKFSKKIACENGLLDPETGELHPFTLNEMTMFSIPTRYDPEAKCPKFMTWLEEVQPDINNRMLLQEWSGYTLLPDYRFHKALFCWGEGRNGKSVWANTIKMVLGEHNVSQVPLEDLYGDNRFALIALYGKLFNVSSEPSTKRAMETPNFKRVTGGDTIAGEQKYKDERIHFVNVSKITVLGNSFPRVDDHSLGFKDRLLFLKWTVSFTDNKAIPNIQETWRDEAPGILNWMLEGLHRLLKQGHFTVSESSIEMHREYMRQSDNIYAFIQEETEPHVGARIAKQALYDAYVDYCERFGLSEASPTAFTRRLIELKQRDGVARLDGRVTRVWLNIKLRSAPDESPPNPAAPPTEPTLDADWLNAAALRNRLMCRRVKR